MTAELLCNPVVGPARSTIGLKKKKAQESASSAEGSLVAYYSFDGSSPLAGLSGNCPNVVPQATLSGSAAVVNTSCHFNSCILPNNGYVDTGSLTVFLGLNTSQLSIAMWVMTPSSISSGTLLYKSGMISLAYTTSCSLICPYSLQCTFSFNAQQSQTVSVGGSPFSTNSAYHIACVYDGQQMCLFINGASKTCSSIKSVFTESSAHLLVGSDGSSSWGGTIDEAKLYDDALSASDINLLYMAVAPNDAPTVLIEVNGTTLSGSYSAPALSMLNATSDVTDTREAFSGAPESGDYAAGFGYTWSALTSQCGIVDVVSGAGQSASLSLNDPGSFTLHLCVSDGEIATEAVVSTFITASTPRISRQPDPSTIQIPEGSVEYPISVEAEGLPTPSYQWQQLVTVEYNATTNSTTSNSTAKRDDDDLEMEFDSENGDEEDFYEEREVVTQQEFEDIAGQTDGILLVNGTSNMNGTVIRCLIFNGGGFVLTNNFTIFISRASVAPSSPAGGGNSNVAIIGGVVGGVGGLLLLCCVVLVLAAFLWGWRRGRSPYRRLKQPDYDAIAYGDVTGEVVLPKKQLDHFHTLERLLIAPRLRLAHAILRTTNSNLSETDQVCRWLLRVLEDNRKGTELILGSITHEVERADEEGVLFRANSVAAKLFSAYIKMAALRYLWHTLVLSVHSLNDNAVESFATNESEGDGAGSRRSAGSQMMASRVGRYKIDLEYEDEEDGASATLDILGTSTMELDPTKITDIGDITINTLELWLVAQKMLKFVTESERRMPRELRQIIERLHEEVGGKFSETATYRAMGGFYFLRLICPALTAPQAFGLLDAPPHQVAQRQLILVSKVLQNLANDTLPGVKEEYMQRLNNFIVTNKPVLDRFYEAIVDQPNKGRPAQVLVPESAKNDALLGLRRYIASNIASIEAQLRDESEGGPEEEQEAAEDLINALNYVLKQMGDLDGEGKFISDEELGDLDL